MSLTYMCGFNVSFVRTLFYTALALSGLALERGQVWFGLVFLYRSTLYIHDLVHIVLSIGFWNCLYLS